MIEFDLLARDTIFDSSLDEIHLHPFGSRDCVLRRLLLGIIREEEWTQDGEHDHELDEDDKPKNLARPRQPLEAICI